MTNSAGRISAWLRLKMGGADGIGPRRAGRLRVDLLAGGEKCGSPSAAGRRSPVIYSPADQAADLPGVSDPTLFILPNDHGFSGPAWMQFPPSIYAFDPPGRNPRVRWNSSKFPNFAPPWSNSSIPTNPVRFDLRPEIPGPEMGFTGLFAAGGNAFDFQH